MTGERPPAGPKAGEALPPGGLERRFDLRFVAAMALREKQVQQNYRPVIAVHKWFARRPGSLFRALLLSEFSDRPLPESYFRAHCFGSHRGRLTFRSSAVRAMNRRSP